MAINTFNLMPKAFKYIFFLLLIYPVSISARPQIEETKIKISEEKVFIKGKKYFIHKVEKGHTLYSISKVYGLTQKELALENPGVFMGIKTGQSLLIPFVNEKIEEPEIRDTTNFIYHLIEKGQTLYYLSKKFEIDIDDILKHNEIIEGNNLSIGDEIKIPKTKDTPRKRRFEVEDKLFIYHKVISKSETIFSLSKKYDVKVREIKIANPNMRWGLDVNEIYKIPKKENQIEIQEELISEINYDSLTNKINVDLSYCEELRDNNESKRYTVLLLLPLFSSINDTLDINDTIPMPERILPESERFLEFLYGAMIALDSLKKEGLSVDLIVEDTEMDPETVEEIFQRLNLRDIDLIIGPIWSNCLKIANRYSRSYGIKLVSPLSINNEIIENNPYSFQVMPSEPIQFDVSSSYLSKFYDKNIVFIMRGK